MPATVTEERRFPPPWKVEELEACFIVIDGAGHAKLPELLRT
jgi:hypothetical protein